MDEGVTTFCIGHHETNRALPVTAQIIQGAHEANVGSHTAPDKVIC
jgi:hypothetical protein